MRRPKSNRSSLYGRQRGDGALAHFELAARFPSVGMCGHQHAAVTIHRGHWVVCGTEGVTRRYDGCRRILINPPGIVGPQEYTRNRDDTRRSDIRNGFWVHLMVFFLKTRPIGLIVAKKI
jgi:hypothetical protein